MKAKIDPFYRTAFFVERSNVPLMFSSYLFQQTSLLELDDNIRLSDQGLQYNQKYIRFRK